MTRLWATLAVLTGCAADPSRIPAPVLARDLAVDASRYAIVDVRSAAEFRAATGHLAGAQHHPWPDVRDRAGEITVSPGQEIVLICLTGHRSQWAKPSVQEAFPGVPVRDLRGGMVAWWARRLGVVREPAL